MKRWDVLLNKNRQMDLRTRGRLFGFVPRLRDTERSVIGKHSGWFKKTAAVSMTQCEKSKINRHARPHRNVPKKFAKLVEFTKRRKRHSSDR